MEVLLELFIIEIIFLQSKFSQSYWTNFEKIKFSFFVFRSTPRCIFQKCIYPKCIFAKCMRLALVLSFASLFQFPFFKRFCRAWLFNLTAAGWYGANCFLAPVLSRHDSFMAFILFKSKTYNLGKGYSTKKSENTGIAKRGWGIVGKSDFESGILILESIFPNFSEYFS